VNCASPIRQGISDEGGILNLEVATGGVLGAGFDGYLKVDAPTETCTNTSVFGEAAPALCTLALGCDPDQLSSKCQMPTFAPAMLFFNPAVRASSTTPLVLPLLPTSAVLSILGAAGTEGLDPTTGFLFVTILDCDGTPAANATVSVDSPETVNKLYIDHGVISASAQKTDVSGLAGVSNVPPGFIKVSAFSSDALPVRLGEVGVQIAPFTITYATIMPTQ
jgi:hypothetical protein